MTAEVKKPDYKKSAKEATLLLEKFNYSAPPVDPEHIAEELGIDVVYAEFEPPHDEDVSGFYEFEKKTIYINRNISENRITFTIAHELAHALMHEDYSQSNDYQPMLRRNVYGEEKPNEEIEADQFAAHLLVPGKMLKLYKSLATVSELAKLFFVSEEVIRNRLAWLDRHPYYAK